MSRFLNFLAGPVGFHLRPFGDSLLTEQARGGQRQMAALLLAGGFFALAFARVFFVEVLGEAWRLASLLATSVALFAIISMRWIAIADMQGMKPGVEPLDRRGSRVALSVSIVILAVIMVPVAAGLKLSLFRIEIEEQMTTEETKVVEARNRDVQQFTYFVEECKKDIMATEHALNAEVRGEGKSGRMGFGRVASELKKALIERRIDLDWANRKLGEHLASPAAIPRSFLEKMHFYAQKVEVGFSMWIFGWILDAVVILMGGGLVFLHKRKLQSQDGWVYYSAAAQSAHSQGPRET